MKYMKRVMFSPMLMEHGDDEDRAKLSERNNLKPALSYANPSQIRNKARKHTGNNLCMNDI